MSSLSGDESNDIMDNEPVRRTRSGRAVKKVAVTHVAKKTPAKKLATRATRASRIILEENIPVEPEISTPENGLQQEVNKEEQVSCVENSETNETLEQVDNQEQEQLIENEVEEHNNDHMAEESESSLEAAIIPQQDQENSCDQEQENTVEQEEESIGETEQEQVFEQEIEDNMVEQEQENVVYEEEIEDNVGEEQVQESVTEQEQENSCEQEQENSCEQEQGITYEMEQESMYEVEQETVCEEEQILEQQEQMEECEAEEATAEGEEIVEFEPNESEAQENKSDEAESENQPEAELMAVDEEAVPSESPENTENTETTKSTLRIKAVSEMMEENVDDQCILIEDDIDQFGMEEEEKDKEENKNARESKFLGHDSEIIPDNDHFRNQDVEFISECNEGLESLSHSNQDHEIIEISDHESEPASKKNDIDTEAVSEDELPTEAAAKHLNACEDIEEVSEDEFIPNEITLQEPETEAVSDEELPVVKPADLGETESVSDEELPVESDRKKKGNKAAKSSEKKSKSESNKRKRNVEGEYDPSSPTSENNDETPAKKAAISSDASNDKTDAKPPSPKKKTLPELDKYWKAVNDDPSDFTGWTYLLQYVDLENDAEAARHAYNEFLERYPYCYGYWRKYADYEKKKGDPERVQTVLDQGLKSISLSVDLWLHYINYCKVVHEKDEEKMRSQYERAIKACGLEFRSDKLWESYIKWETENRKLDKVMAIYDRLLCIPTLGYLTHFENFQDFVTTNSPNKILSVDGFLELRSEVKASLKSDDSTGDEAPPGEELDKDAPPTDEETRAIREKIISTRRKMHKSNVNAVAARWTFEEGIKRPYFHVKPLERCQLKNWKEYLDYEIDQKNQDRIIILFERCLIACALYDEFWMRFVRYLESMKGENIDKIRDVYTRACKVHHPKKPNLHLQWATFEENLGNFDKAATILENIDNAIPNVLQIAYRRINLERRRDDLVKTCSLYEHYINNSKNKTISNNVVIRYARFLCKIMNDTDKAVKVLLKATEKDKDNPRLYLQLIDLGLQRNPIDIEEVISYMDMFTDREHADAEQRVLFAHRKVEFLEDFSTDIRQVLKAQEQLQKCIKQAKERKKTKNDENKSDAVAKKAKTDTASVPPPTVGSQSYQYGTAAYQSQQQFPSGQYGSQSGYQQGYQQYPPPSDPNYANYQNWQYSQSGPQAYNPYNQWGSYNYY